MATRIHPTAIIEDGVEIGDGTAIWAHAHIRARTRVGRDCIIGGQAQIAYDNRIGDRVKIGARAYLCTGVTVEDGVMLAAGVVFTNDRYPRATTPDLERLQTSEPTEDTLHTVVRRGVTIGAAAIIGPGLDIGEFAMIGMGSVVTRPVPAFHLVAGNPARPTAVVCRCGRPVHRFGAPPAQTSQSDVHCAACGRSYGIASGVVSEHAGP